MNRKNMLLAIIWFTAFGLPGAAFTAQDNLSLGDKEIIEKLARLEEGQNGLNMRIDDQSKRIDDLRSDLKGDISDLRSLTYLVLAGTIALIGFVVWDRRTALSPVIRKTS